jgi:hypothetical protein
MLLYPAAAQCDAEVICLHLLAHYTLCVATHPLLRLNIHKRAHPWQQAVKQGCWPTAATQQNLTLPAQVVL